MYNLSAIICKNVEPNSPILQHHTCVILRYTCKKRKITIYKKKIILRFFMYFVGNTVILVILRSSVLAINFIGTVVVIFVNFFITCKLC